MAAYTVTVADEVQNAEAKLGMFARQLENGEALLTPIPKGFPMQAMPEVAARVAHMLRQYVELYAPKEPEQEDAHVPT
jgi:hypothetical protein